MQEVNLIGVLSTGGRLPVIEPKTITENGTYNVPSGVDGFNPVVVDVPSQEPNIQSKSIFENGTYNAPSGVDGFNPVVVDVPSKEEITLYVNQNGTYTPDENRVYNNVVANVPLPSNAYLLKSITTPTPIASFSDGEEMVMPSLKVAIEPQQDLSHGDPSPTNICPISGWDEVMVTVADDVDNPTVSHEYTIDLDGTRYGGEVDLVNGDGTDRLGSVDMGTLNWSKGNINTARTGRIFYVTLATSPSMKQPSDNGFCEALKYNPFSNWSAGQWERQILNGITVTNSSALVVCVPDIYSTASDFKTAMNGVKFVYELATPTTYDTQPTAVKSLRGVNNVYANTGKIKDAEYFSKEV